MTDRDLRVYDDLDALVAAIEDDVARTRAVLGA